MQKRIDDSRIGNWDDLRIFLAVARAASFSRAAAALDMNQSNVSRRIQGLEARIGTKLFDRHGKGVVITPLGKSILEQVAHMETVAHGIERRIAGGDYQLEGSIKVTATEGLASHWLTPRLVRFQREYPRILVEVITGNAMLDLAKREADIAVRLTRPTDPRLVAAHVGQMTLALYSSREYEATYGVPRALDDLGDHRLVDHPPYHSLPFWRDLVSGHPAVSYRTNSSIAYMEAVKSGFGIGIFPTYSTHIVADLVRVPIDIDCRREIWLVTHEETNGNAKIKLMVGYIKNLFRTDRATWFS